MRSKGSYHYFNHSHFTDRYITQLIAIRVRKHTIKIQKLLQREQLKKKRADLSFGKRIVL